MPLFERIVEVNLSQNFDDMQDSKYTFIDLFSGCGGLSLGFEMAGYKSLLAIDNWQDALDTYKHNNHDARTLCGDLSIINPENIKREYNIDRVSVIIGGPPCQGFSIAGKRIFDDRLFNRTTANRKYVWDILHHKSIRHKASNKADK